MEFNTERLLLRSLVSADVPLLVDFYTRNREFFREWEPLRNDAFYLEASMRSVITKEAESNADRAGLYLYIFRPEGPGIIGSISLTNIVYGPFLSCFLGYKLDEKETGKGIMTEALRQVIWTAFTDYGLHRIEANIMPRNSRSINLVKKAGFHEEGVSKKYLKINGKWEDHLHFVLLNKDLE